MRAQYPTVFRRWPKVASASLIALAACAERRESLSWRVIAQGSVAVESVLTDSVTASTIEVRGGGRVDTVRNVTPPWPLIVGDSMIVGIVWANGKDDRSFFRAMPRAGAPVILDAPGDINVYFTDISISPDAHSVLYMGYDSTLWHPVIVRRWPGGEILVRSDSTPNCECDIDFHHAHWVTTDSFEFATMVDTARWQRVAGSATSRRFHIDTILGEPHWHPDNWRLP